MLQLLQSLLNRNRTSPGSFPQRPGFGPQARGPRQPMGRNVYPPQHMRGMNQPPRSGQLGPWQMPQQNMFPQHMNRGTFSQPGGGFLSKLLGGSGQSGVAGSDISGMLTNIQSTLRMAESALPMIQQYGPMVKNIPSMLQLIKEFNNLEDVEEDENSEEEIEETEEMPDVEIEDAEQMDVDEEILPEEKEIKSNVEKKSQAKLYI